ncbi:hypothetical protein KO02_12130 [Sphingobacterium sp. ML3W]|nr:hypothetical protein KO02_12130 [Sphingobacterium sp. ML3W]
MENQTYNANQAIKAQKSYCEKSGDPHFAPTNGICYRCKNQIYFQINHGSYSTGISVEKATNQLITGCPHCHRSYCD